MPKSTIELVRSLLVHFRQFTELCRRWGPELQGPDIVPSVELAYSRLTFSIKRSEVVYLQYTISRAESGSQANPECYYHDAQQVEAVKKHFAPLVDSPVSVTMAESDSAHTIFPEDLDRYLSIAESIASRAYLCTAGDDYWPGYFSQISIDADQITLEQVNHMNSRSLDHKNNYTMRELEFSIPLRDQPTAQKSSVGITTYHVGTMRIRFSDRSSQSNRTCGDRIREAIEEERQKDLMYNAGTNS